MGNGVIAPPSDRGVLRAPEARATRVAVVISPLWEVRSLDTSGGASVLSNSHTLTLILNVKYCASHPA